MTADSRSESAIAVIGLAGRFPGADDVDAFWSNLWDGRESISVFATAELRKAGIPTHIAEADGYVAAKGVISGPDYFDAGFFGYSPAEAAAIDPQQRLFLECAWLALEDAGYGCIDGDMRVGVFGSAGFNSYLALQLIEDPGMLHSPDQFMMLISSDKDFLCTRVAQKLGLRGPAMTVQSACSSSLLAVHLACQSLVTGEIDMAVAGGVSITFPVTNGYRSQQGGIHSRDGHCRAFDADSSGFVPGNGAGVVVLKRLTDAKADVDPIYAAILGSAANNDGGRAVGYTAPSVDGQAEVIAEALAVAGVDPSEVGYVEAHGTATAVGDLIEIEALTRVFGRPETGAGSCAIGSVKTNIGHLDTAAGVAGLIKAVLAVHKGGIPPSLNFRRPNPRFDFARTPFFVPTDRIEWPTTRPKIAGVSSFGVGGTNVHVVIGEAGERSACAATSAWKVLPLSARSPSALDALHTRLMAHLEAHEELDLADVAFTLSIGRRTFEQRGFIVAKDCCDAAAKLGSGLARGPREVKVDRKVAFLFPGGGAQYSAMGRELYASVQRFREIVDECAALLSNELTVDVRSLLYPSSTDPPHGLKNAESALPCLFVTEYALAKTLIDWGIRPSGILGHSLGEYVGACLSGVMSLSSALKLVALRGRLLDEIETGAMISVNLSAEAIDGILPLQLSLAAINAPEFCVVSGLRSEIAAFAERLAGLGVDHSDVPIGVPAHSALVDGLLDRFALKLAEIELRPPRIPLVSNVSGDWLHADEVTDPNYWVRHLRSTVLFADGLRTIRAAGDPVLLEVGPGHTLRSLAMLQGDDDRWPDALTSMAHPSQAGASDLAELLRAVGSLWALGVPVDWSAYFAPEKKRRVRLPGYPFERVRHTRLATTREVGHLGVAQPWQAARAQVFDAATAPISVTDAEPPVPSSAPEGARVEQRLQSLFAGLFGLTPDQIDPKRRLVELGADSFLFVRASQKIQDEFGTAIPFRVLFGELATIEATAAWIAEEGRSRSAGLMVGARDHSEVRHSTRRYGSADLHASVSRPVPANRPDPPRLPDPGQQKRIDALCQRVARKTAGSKMAAERSRGVLADNRGSAGFNPLWKEMVYPIVARRSQGSRMVDVDGNEYVDIAMGFGVSLFGHAAPFVREALEEQLREGFQLGPQSDLAGEVARLISETTGVERVAFANSGTEAIMTAIRLARLATARRKIVVFDGSYHGFYDGTLGRMAADSEHAVPVALGLTPGAVQDLVVLPYASPASLAAIEKMGDELAAVLVEPIQSRHPELQPRDFLGRLREVTKASKTLLVFDEVITGFRLHPGGAQAYFEVQADLAVYGKVVGGGMPIGVVGGRGDVMDGIDGGHWRFGDMSYPAASQTFVAGTFCKHPLAMAAAKAVLEHLRDEGPKLQHRLNRRAASLAQRLNELLATRGGYYCATCAGSLFRLQPTSQNLFPELLFFSLLDNGVYTWEGRTCFLSTAHSDEDLDAIAKAVDASAAEIQLIHNEGEARKGARRPCTAAASMPLTPGQSDIWARIQGNDEASRAYNESMVVTLAGSLDVAALRQTIAILAERHESLRTTFSEQGQEQIVLHRATIDLPIIDFSGLPGAEQAAQEWAGAEAARLLDVGRGPLLRTALGRTGPQSHKLVLTLHHLIGDGYSSGVLLREGAAIYSAIVLGKPAALDPPTQYRDYVRHLRECRRSGRLDKDIRHWLRVFEAPPPPLALSTDFSRAPVRRYIGGHATLTLGRELHARLQHLAGKLGVRHFSLLLAGYGLLLHHLTGSRDLLIGVPSAGQLQHGFLNLVGYCLNVIPHRSMLRPGSSVRDFIAHTDAMIAESYDHQLGSLGELLRLLKLRREPGRSPFLETIFNLDRSLAPELDFAGLTTTVRENQSGAAKCDLIWNLAEDEGGLVVDCVFNASLFRAASVREWADQFVQLCELLAQFEARSVTDLFAALATAQDEVRVARRTERRRRSMTLYEAAIRPPSEEGDLS